MTRTILLAAFLSVSGSATIERNQAADLPGLRLDDERWAYKQVNREFDGILLRPEGRGPFPAVLISHGLGGGAESFGLQKAREMVRWGYVCIAPNYTHNRRALEGNRAGAGGLRRPGGAAAGRQSNFGASDENLARAEICLKILASLPEVDADRVYAYGHSMGGFVTIALAARAPKGLVAAAVSGSGVAPRAGFPAPAVEAAAKIRTPLILFHGADDTTVRPEQSAMLQEALDRNKVPCERHVYEGVGHPVDQQRSAEMYRRIQAWFDKYAPKI